MMVLIAELSISRYFLIRYRSRIILSISHIFAAQDRILHTGSYDYGLPKAKAFRTQVLATS